VREPWLYLPQTWEALAEGGFFGALVPTTNQVSDLVAGLEQGHFTDIEVCEILLRSYKPVPARLRPVDRMVAHTGYLVFARRLEKPVTVGAEESHGSESGLDSEETHG
jgi:tRNA (adenine57-N1/adenine58-N1)-methyltransferase